MSNKNVGMIDAVYNSLKPITLADYTTQLAKPGKLYPFYAFVLPCLLSVLIQAHQIAKFLPTEDFDRSCDA